ncbi:1-acyl-sn-glycerol-3-phosphate acyltransferase [Secundilactobacillus pentosiphilus]|uniref:1-acyl-sn-glycerol-3-phosphate acyltransferase n=1 Tax=Secundilactobacillus pentosiphilus TaxID=1714682 RepID=A0A1Z5IM20_9LACO|nr:acyl-phosphate glycerol 3-phosphate acyltransferase [Secundilactobacillus pentosiphilus]GAX02622.1 1-acyl-sn-glycerol-3-phosphate acyltransferase [Secundilactobacillus pentosiphilus]
MRFKKGQTVYYGDTSEDIVETTQQDFRLPADYRWQTNALTTILRHLFQFMIQLFARFYCRWILHIHYVNRQLVKKASEGCYLYANHTQQTGDVFSPFCVANHPAILISPANLGIPVVGKLLPLGGGLPISSSLHQLKTFNDAVYQRLDAGDTVVIYPESHLWPYATDIRPLDHTSFHYPANHPAPVYTMTTTYQKSRWHRHPNVTVYLDGPFQPDISLPIKSRQKKLHEQVTAQLQKRSRNSTYQYVIYKRRPTA